MCHCTFWRSLQHFRFGDGILRLETLLLSLLLRIRNYCWRALKPLLRAVGSYRAKLTPTVSKTTPSELRNRTDPLKEVRDSSLSASAPTGVRVLQLAVLLFLHCLLWAVRPIQGGR